MEKSQTDLREKLKSFKLPKGVSSVITQRKAVRDNIDYIKKRASGEIIPLQTDYNKLNSAVGGGFELNTMLTISGLSGGGNSTINY